MMRSPSKADSSVPILKSMRTKRHRLACPSCESVTYGLRVYMWGLVLSGTRTETSIESRVRLLSLCALEFQARSWGKAKR